MSVSRLGRGINQNDVRASGWTVRRPLATPGTIPEAGVLSIDVGRFRMVGTGTLKRMSQLGEHSAAEVLRQTVACFMERRGRSPRVVLVDNEGFEFVADDRFAVTA